MMLQTTTDRRIAGFDLARAYALFGMYIVNFVFCFGSFQDKRPMGHFLNLFVGNSTSVFIILAGLGLSTMVRRHPHPDGQERARLRSVVLKRSLFLFALGLLFYNWWPGDILHFYGSYLHIGAALLFVPGRCYLWAGLLVLLLFHLMLLLLPVTTGWDLSTFHYADFWTPTGFLRNTFYNGWNAVLPWLFYFLLGMWLGRLDWRRRATRARVLAAGLGLFLLFEGLRWLVKAGYLAPYRGYILSDYLPAYPPYLLITTGYALMVISIAMQLGQSYPGALLIRLLARTGRMTLSLYLLHLTLGVLLLSGLSHKPYTGYPATGMPVAPAFLFLYASAFFVLSLLLANWWQGRFRHGPLELLMRKISG